ncbi:MAG: serine/threonine-protein kinase [Leptolyngbyaceae bacterium]|nr:serine/threonine-protein kinase [Leptolyngbyaceae bacterium]
MTANSNSTRRQDTAASTPPANPNIGRVLVDRYILGEQLGQGSMGQVYAAKDKKFKFGDDKGLAIKFLAQSLMNDRMKERFELEANICAELGRRSIHIIRVIDHGVDEFQTPFYVMDYLEGHSLNDVIRENPLPIPRFLNFCRQICLGLQKAHQGIEVNGEICPIIHRDIKPSNIFITSDETLGELVKILDFGIAKTLQDDTENSQTKCFMGTLAYSSPEQMEGRDLDHRSDIYSLGIMLFQMLTGKMPLNADTRTFGGWYQAHREKSPRLLRDANPGIKVPKLLESLIMSCLEKEPDNRPQNVADIITELAPLWKRFRQAEDIGGRIQGLLRNVPVQPGRHEAQTQPETSIPGSSSERFHQTRATSRRPGTILSPDEICHLAQWPNHMPPAEIVFPKILETSERSLATLWAMLPQATIDGLRYCLPYNQYLFTPSPYPVLLWLTVLYATTENKPKWLPCYLDLKQSSGQDMLKLLVQSKEYRILFFPLESPQRCALVQTLSITEPAPDRYGFVAASNTTYADKIEAQAKKLDEFAVMSHMLPQTPPEMIKFSKSELKKELEKLKPIIEQKLEAIPFLS